MESFRTRSFWLEGAFEGYVPNAPLKGDRNYDFVIVGGGFTGLSAA